MQKMVWRRRPDGNVFQDRVCIDGSALLPEDPVLVRAGWSVVSVDSAGELTGCLYGNLPHLVQDSGAAELYAFCMALVHALPPVTVVTDYQGLIDGAV